MKKMLALSLLASVIISCNSSENSETVTPQASVSAADRALAVEIQAAENAGRNNASGAAVTSGAHSDAHPGICFVWSPKAPDSGYLKVSAWVFETYESFILTAKEANTYWDYAIAPREGQPLSGDGCYVFYLPRASGNKNINMVFLSGWLEKTVPVEEDAELFEFSHWGFTSGVMPNRIIVIHEDENAVFDCTVDNGEFVIQTPYPYPDFRAKNVSVHSGYLIHWADYLQRVDHALIEVVVKLEGHIIGYAVIEVTPTSNVWVHIPTPLKSVLFPRIDGKYQNVSGEYVKTAIEKIKGGSKWGAQ
jgi:hypothetical protein